MKKIISFFILALMFAPVSLAADFDYGQDNNGLYYSSESKNMVYSRDASCLMQSASANVLCSTQWYVNKNQMKMSDSYYNRIKAMLILSAK